MRDSGIVSDRPTVTTSGVVRSIAYAQDMSLMKDEIELSYCLGKGKLVSRCSPITHSGPGFHSR